MTIEEAIALLEHYVRSGQILNTPESLRFYNGDRESAVKLGLEALRHFRDARKRNAVAFKFLLPGETEK